MISRSPSGCTEDIFLDSERKRADGNEGGGGDGGDGGGNGRQTI